MIFITINDIHRRIIVFIVIVAMVINKKMARRCSLGSRADGFYLLSGIYNMCPSKRKPTLQVKSYYWDN